MLPRHDAGHTDPTEPQKLIQFVPRALQNAVVKVDARLPIVGAGYKPVSTVKSFNVVVEARQHGFHKVTLTGQAVSKNSFSCFWFVETERWMCAV